MKKKKIAFSVIFFSLTIQAQGRFNGYVVTNANDTIKCKFSLEMNIFNDSLFYDSGISDRAKIFLLNGTKVKYKPSEIKSVFITGPKQGDYKFVSLKADNYEHLYHEKIKGKLSFYVLYKGNLSGGFPFEKPFILKDNKLVSIDGFNRRKAFGELIVDYPELHQKWMDSNNYYKIDQMDEVLKLYNEHFQE